MNVTGFVAGFVLVFVVVVGCLFRFDYTQLIWYFCFVLIKVDLVYR